MTDRTRVCRICGIEKDADAFRPKHARCRDCFNAMRREASGSSVYRDCSECGTHFHAWPAVRLTCGPVCSAARERKQRGWRDTPEADCAKCGTRFQPQQLENIFCSAACKDRARYARRRVDPVYLAGRAEYRSKHYFENREECLARSRVWREANREHHRELSRAWSRSQPDGYGREKVQAWRDRNRERAQEATRSYRARKRDATTAIFSVADVEAKLAYWRNRCWMCGQPATSLDHVKPLIAGGPHMLANFRPACGSCNSAKGGRWYGPQNLSLFLRE